MLASVRKAVPVYWTLLSIAAMTGSAVAAGGDGVPIALQLSLQERKVMLGTPIVLEGLIINRSQDPVGVVIGQERTDWLRVEMQDATGKKLPRALDIRHTDCWESHQGSTARLDAVNSSLPVTLIANQHVSPQKPGRYQLLIRAELPYKATSEPGLDLREMASFDRIVEEWTFDLEITKPEPERLRKMAQEFAAEVLNPKAGYTRRMLAVDMLFSMSEQYVLPEWRALVLSRDLEWPQGRGAMSQLLRIGTPAAADLLAAMWDNHNTSAKCVLKEMWKTGGPDMKKHVEGLFAARGQEVPMDCPG